jgi:hypothetical protein
MASATFGNCQQLRDAQEVIDVLMLRASNSPLHLGVHRLMTVFASAPIRPDEAAFDQQLN